MILQYISWNMLVVSFPTVLSGTVQEINPTHLYMWFHNFLIYVTLILVFMYASLIGNFSLNQCTCDYIYSDKSVMNKFYQNQLVCLLKCLP